MLFHSNIIFNVLQKESSVSFLLPLLFLKVIQNDGNWNDLDCLFREKNVDFSRIFGTPYETDKISPIPIDTRWDRRYNKMR